VLTIDEMRELSRALRDVFAFLSSLRGRVAAAAQIRNPQVPTALSESLAAHLLQSGSLLPQAIQVRCARDGGDLEGELPDGHTLSIEVKATGEAGRQRVTKKDLEADLLIWIDFGSYFVNPEVRQVSVVRMSHPGRYITRVGEISYHDFLKACVRAEGQEIALREVDIQALFEEAPTSDQRQDA